jgi:hypothetical protein
MREDAPLAAVNRLVDDGMRAGCTPIMEEFVILCFGDMRVLRSGIDLLQCLGGVDDDVVWRVADNGAVDIMAFSLIQMSVLLPGMIGIIPRSDLGKKRAWILRQRMKRQPVYNHAKSIENQRGCQERKSRKG